MSGGIEEPYTIASLPKPLDSEKGRTLGANVFSINGSRKRKRHEIAIGVDGESVNIYNTQNQSNASSYALPPQSYLAAPPCSIYCKRSKPLQPQRQTYIAVKDARSGQKVRLVSITENLGKPQSDEREPRAPTRRERKLRQGSIVALDTVPFSTSDGQASDSAPVLVSYTNGNVDCISAELSASRWEHTAALEDGSQVEFASVVDFDTARKGLLKNREDVLALLDPATTGIAAPALLVQVVRSGSQRLFNLYAIRNAHGDVVGSHRSPLDNVLSYDLPGRHGQNADVAHYELHAASGMLYQRVSNRLHVFDLSGTTPRVSFELGRKSSPQVDSFIRLSAATVLVVSPSNIAVYDTKYGSVLSSLAWSPQNAQSTPTSLTLLTQFSDLSIVAALSGTNLVALQVGDMLDDGRRAKSHGPLLLEVMGKGKISHEVEVHEKKERKRKKWDEWKASVDHFVSHSDVEGLEKLVAKDLKLTTSADSEDHQNGETNGHANGHTDSEHDVWDLPATAFDSQFVDGRKAMYILGKIFSWRRGGAQTKWGEHHLEIALLSKNILRWLATAGYITAAQIKMALPKPASASESRSSVAPGDIMVAIGEAEPNLLLMCDLISLPVHWALAEVIQGLQILIRSFENRDLMGTIEGPDSSSSDDVVMANGDVDSELDAANKQLDEAEGVLESGLVIRSEACRLLLARLQSFPQKDVVRIMHQLLTHNDIIFFICILRLELADGGWTQRYIEQDNAREEEAAAGLGSAQELSPSNQAIRTIANLFSCAVDAIGLSGWLVGLSADSIGTHELIQSLKNEISAAVEGLFEAELLDTMLREIGRTAGAAEQQNSSLKRKRQDDRELSPEEVFMPLGGRAEPPVLGPRNEFKSKAALAEEKSRKVGKYSFERIRI